MLHRPFCLLGRPLPWASSTPSGLLGGGQSPEASGTVALPDPLPLAHLQLSIQVSFTPKPFFPPLYFSLRFYTFLLSLFCRPFPLLEGVGGTLWRRNCRPDSRGFTNSRGFGLDGNLSFSQEGKFYLEWFGIRGSSHYT